MIRTWVLPLFSLSMLGALGCTSKPPVCYDEDDPGRPDGPHVLRNSDGECVRVSSIDGDAGLDSGADAKTDAAIPNPALLSTLTLASPATLAEKFDSTQTNYSAHSPFLAHELYLTATAIEGTSITIGGQEAISGQTVVLPLPTGQSQIEVVARSPGLTDRPYTITVTRAATLEEGSYFKASNSDPSDAFGSAVALDGDWLAIGALVEASGDTGNNANQNNNESIGAGAVYIFARSGTSWEQVAYIKPSLKEVNFGRALALSGDTLAVGCVDRVYIFRYNGQQWSEEAHVRSENFDADDNFGYAVSIFKDTLLVGAPDEASMANTIGGDGSNNDAPKSGAAYVFQRSGSQWNQQAYIKGSKSQEMGAFGTSVALQTDTLIIGSSGERNTFEGAGSAYIFQRKDNTWEEIQRLSASNPGNGDEFGKSVALAGDLIVIGASSESSSSQGVNGDQSNNSAEASGAVYLFDKQDLKWQQKAYLKASNTNAGDGFGESVSTDGQFVVVGAPREGSHSPGIGGDQLDNSRSAAGAVYLFERQEAGWKQVHYIKSRLPFDNGNFGSATALNRGTLLVGERGEGRNARGVDSATAGELLYSGAAFSFR